MNRADALPLDFVYDIETPINCFTMVLKHIATNWRWIYEISDFENHGPQLVMMLRHLRSSGARMVGFNNLGFDYPVLHHMVKVFDRQGYVTALDAHAKAMEIINSFDQFSHMIWPSDRIVKQLDLYKIHHFDNQAKRTSLKALQFNMRSPSLEDLPFDPNLPIASSDIETVVIPYNAHDVDETETFYFHSLPMIRFRDELTVKYGKDFTNHNDTKIGKDYFIMQLEKALPGSCYKPDRKPRQTFRRSIPLRSVIFPYIAFQHPEFDRVLTYLKTVDITNTKSAPELNGTIATINGFDFIFGLGGIHGSVSNKTIRASDTHEVVDIDVKSFYPNIAIVNRCFPEHLSEKFCDIYADLYHQRAGFPKKSAENAMLKLALNGVYGDSNNVHSPFYDSQYTMTITVNGQLLLCKLAETLLTVPEFEIIQINTDGMTMRIPRTMRSTLDAMCKHWEAWSCLELEFAEYGAMFIRDVNNYVAVGTDGKVKKRKGAYQWDTSEPNNVSISRTWSQDWSALIVPRAAEAVMVDGADLETFIHQHTDPFDFMLRAKVNRASRLVAHDDGYDQPLQRITRYHVATSGPQLFKIMPPLASKPGTGERRFAIEKGWSVRICDRVEHFDWLRLNRSYYVQEAEKLLKVIR